MKKHISTRIISMLLALVLCVGLMAPVGAASNGTDTALRITQVDNDAVSANPLTQQMDAAQEAAYAATDVVRVSIVLEEQSTIAAGFSTENIARNAEAMAYRAALKNEQADITAAIERQTGEKLDVVWNLTLAANIISANVEYGQIAAIESIRGVDQVLIETRYAPDVVSRDENASPNMATSGKQIGSLMAWNAGYTGAGSRIAIIDTGLDVDHQSFDEGAYQYALALQAEKLGMSVEAYVASLDLLDAAEIAELAEDLNAPIDAETAYLNTKLPYGYNYVDDDYQVTHMNDMQGEHGSHVAGISAANAYIPDGDGSYVKALDSVMMQGVAPDAQVLVMKVFGKTGGAYDSDYMVAIEDAVVLGCDAVNLSLGSGYAGNSRSTVAAYQAIMDNLVASGTVVTMSAGNSGTWAVNAANGGVLYAEDVSMQTNAAPGTFTNSLSVASVENDGLTSAYITVGDQMIIYNENLYSNQPFTGIAGKHEYVFIDGIGTAEDWAQVSDVLEGKIALCYRGSINFAEKAINAVNAGAIATFIVNNEPGVISMDLTDYYYTNPAASINQADGELIKAASTAVTDTAGNVLYYTGTMDVSTSLGAVQLNSDYYTMSSFSSWGVPGSLELKPEITAPGGNIYSLNGMSAAGGGHDQYIAMSGTSMAAPQMAGMAALVMQYIRANELDSKTGLDARTLAQSLLMSTAVPMLEAEGAYYPVLQQGAGLGNVGTAVTADSYILMQENATASWADGKVKVELGDDPQREGAYEFSFTLHNLTDVEKSFDLSADFFMQRPVDDGAGNCCMGTSTDLIPVDVVWQVDGLTLETDAALDGMDFNGDGVVNSDDGQTLLDHATGLGTTLSNQDKADLDADGDIDTHDAYLFLRQLSTGVALLPAGGAVEITATVTLSEEWGERVDTYYPNGTYVQGYVFAEGVSSAEGLEGTSHSIPVLGFYGNWTDPSMFEVGSYAEYAAGDVTKLPYMGNGNVNSFGIVFADDPENAYFFGGNPIIADETYLPERNAINSENGDTVHQLSFASIRNAVETRFTAVNKTTGETIVEKYNGPAAAAYYDANWEMWYNSQRVMNTDFMPTGAAEGDIFELTMTLAPEYYMDAEGNVNWDAMGPGASYVVPIVVDNTAPTLTEVSTNHLGNTLTVTASDNQYVAGVVLYNIAGTKRLSVAGAKMDIQPGEEAEYVLDLTGVNGKKFLVQVHDYAMNTVTYILEAEIGEPEPLPDFIAYDLTYEWWASFTKTATYDQVLEYATTDLTFYAATIVDHMILAATDDGTLYVMPEDEMSSMTRVGKLGTIVTDMAYNPADGKVYGVNEHGRLISIDKLTAAVEELGQIGVITNTLACDEDGTFYCNGLGTGTVYSFTLDTIGTPAVLVADLGISSQYIQSMEISPNDGQLYYASYYQIDYGYFAYGYSYFFEIDPETGDAVVYNDLYDQLAAMIIPAKEDQGGDWTKPTDKVSGIQLSETAVSLLRSNQTTLTATVMPWTATDRTVRWSSADESIATVNEDGLVTAVALGTTTITATSNLDPSISASCTVTVETLDLTLEGTLKDADGKNQFFSWNMATDTTWTGGTAIDTSMASATVNAADRKVYIMDAASNDWRVHVVDPATGVSQQTYTNSLGYPLWDMEYSSFFSTAEAPKVHGIYYTYFLPAKDPADLDNVVFDLWAFFAYYSGASGLVGVTSLGKEQRVLNGTLMDTEHVIMLDNAGFIWDFWIYPSEDTVGASAAYSASDLSIVYPGDSTGEHMYSALVAGDDGYLYLSAFTGKTNELYRLSYNAATGIYESLRIADMGENVWPAILTDVRSNTAGTNTLASPEATLELEAVQLSEAELAAAAKHATVAAVAPASEEARAAKMQAEVRPGSDAEIAGETVILNITTEAAATNGLSVVTYDADKLTLESAVIYGDYTARLDETGKLTFGYVALTEIPAGGTIATLTFRAAEAENSVVSVEHRQVNNVAGTTEALLVEFEHANTEIRNAKDATCTEDGYTGDIYCTDCGALITEGEVIPATGHSFGEWTVSKAATCFAEGEEIRVCACGETETRVTEKRTECPSDAFSDLDKTQWYHEGVDFVLDEGLMKGMSDTIFAPNGQVTRAQLVTILYRLEGQPSIEGLENPFEDIAEKDWFYDAVVWAASEGVVNGTSATTFDPNAAITREQIAAILFRYAGAEKVEEDHLEAFADADQISAYAVDAMNWAVANGLIKGLTDTTVAPRATATRAQIATILMRYCN